MTLAAALPDYDFLPAPLWLITILHVLTLTLHFVAMNFLFGGLVVVLFGRFEDKWRHPVVRKVVALFPTLMAATVTLGVAPLLFVQLVYGGQIYSSAIVSGWLWFLIPFVVIVAYYLLYGSAFAKEGNACVKGWIAVTVLCLLYVSLIYSTVFSLAENPALQKELYAQNQSGFVLNPEVGDWLFRWLHMLGGAVTVGAFCVAALARGDERAWNTAKGFFLYGMIATMVVGVVYLVGLGDLLKPFMKSPGIWLLTLGILLSLGSLHFFFKKKLLVTGTMLFVSLLTMVASRHVLRNLALEGTFDPTSVRVAPQWGVFLIFLACFVLALALVAWMLKLFFRPAPD